MKLGNRCCRAAFATSLIIAVALLSTAGQAGAVGRRFASTSSTPVSFLVLNNNGKPVGTSISPCNSKGDCADSIRFDWPAGRCFEQRRYAPIVTVWMYKHNPLPNYWPIVTDCSDGITLYWNSKGVMTPAAWQGAVDEHQDLYRIPKHSDGANIYFQGGESLMQAEWMKAGEVISSVAIPGPADNVYWSSAPFKTTLPPHVG